MTKKNVAKITPETLAEYKKGYAQGESRFMYLADLDNVQFALSTPIGQIIHGQNPYQRGLIKKALDNGLDTDLKILEVKRDEFEKLGVENEEEYETVLNNALEHMIKSGEVYATLEGGIRESIKRKIKKGLSAYENNLDELKQKDAQKYSRLENILNANTTPKPQESKSNIYSNTFSVTMLSLGAIFSLMSATTITGLAIQNTQTALPSSVSAFLFIGLFLLIAGVIGVFAFK